jgi:hypothetical protein
MDPSIRYTELSWRLIFKVFNYLKRQMDNHGPEHGVAKSQERSAEVCSVGEKTVKFKGDLATSYSYSLVSLASTPVVYIVLEYRYFTLFQDLHTYKYEFVCL